MVKRTINNPAAGQWNEIAECGLPTMSGQYLIAEDEDLSINVANFYKKGDSIPCSATESEKMGLSPFMRVLKDLLATKTAEEDGFYEEIAEGEVIRLRRVVAWADIYMPNINNKERDGKNG